MRHLTNESTVMVLFSLVTISAGCSQSNVTIRFSNRFKSSTNGNLKYRPGSFLTETISPNLNTKANSRWSTMNIDMLSSNKATNNPMIPTPIFFIFFTFNSCLPLRLAVAR